MIIPNIWKNKKMFQTTNQLWFEPVSAAKNKSRDDKSWKNGQPLNKNTIDTKHIYPAQGFMDIAHSSSPALHWSVGSDDFFMSRIIAILREGWIGGRWFKDPIHHIILGTSEIPKWSQKMCKHPTKPWFLAGVWYWEGIVILHLSVIVCVYKDCNGIIFYLIKRV